MTFLLLALAGAAPVEALPFDALEGDPSSTWPVLSPAGDQMTWTRHDAVVAGERQHTLCHSTVAAPFDCRPLMDGWAWSVGWVDEDRIVAVRTVEGDGVWSVVDVRSGEALVDVPLPQGGEVHSVGADEVVVVQRQGRKRWFHRYTTDGTPIGEPAFYGRDHVPLLDPATGAVLGELRTWGSWSSIWRFEVWNPDGQSLVLGYPRLWHPPIGGGHALASIRPWDGKLLLFDSTEHDPAALVAMDLQTGEIEEVWQGEEWPVDVLQDADGTPLAVATEHIRQRWHALDPSLADDLDWLHEQLTGDLTLSLRADGAVWKLYRNASDRSTEVWHVDRGTRTLTRLPPSWGAFEDRGWRPSEVVDVEARDGLTVPSLWTTPDPEVWGDGPWPTLVNIHGGPWGEGYVSAGFTEFTQYWTHLGYAVLEPQFRGTGGFTLAYANAWEGEWGDAMVNDVHDVARAAIEAGVADPDRIAYLGMSYGGYAVLRSATTEGDPMTCGVSWMGPARLGHPIFAALWIPDRKRIAPHFAWDRVDTPLLAIAGGRDRRVPPRATRGFARRAAEDGAPLAFVVFPETAHQPDEQVAEQATLLSLRFLGACLGEPPPTTAPIDEPLFDVRIDTLEYDGWLPH